MSPVAVTYTVTLSCGFTMQVSCTPPAEPPDVGGTVWCPQCDGFDIVMSVS